MISAAFSVLSGRDVREKVLQRVCVCVCVRVSSHDSQKSVESGLRDVFWYLSHHQVFFFLSLQGVGSHVGEGVAGKHGRLVQRSFRARGHAEDSELLRDSPFRKI